MSAMSRIWSIDRLGPQVEVVLAAIAQGQDTQTVQPTTRSATY